MADPRRRQLRFFSEAHLRTWLAGHPDGRRIVADLAEERDPLRFDSVEHLRTWLATHPDGRKIMADAVDAYAMDCPAVLVVLHPDGLVQAYCEHWTDVQIVNLPLHDPRLLTADEAHRLNRYVDSSVPRRHAEVYWPNKLRRSGNLRWVTWDELLDEELDVVRLRMVQSASEADVVELSRR